MARKRRPPENLDSATIGAIIDELDSMLEGFDDDSSEDIAYHLDALTTMFLNAKLVTRRRLRKMKFHIAIEEFALDLPDRVELSQRMETFEDLMNAYGDEPSDDEIDEAKEILEQVIKALKSAFRTSGNKGELGLGIES